MSIFDNLKEDLSKDADKAKQKLDETSHVVEEKLTTSEGRKWVKYVCYGIAVIIVLLIGSCMFGSCGKKQQNMALGGAYTGDGVTAPIQPIQQAPVVVQQSGGINGGDLALGYILGQTMSNGQVYNGNNAPTVVHNNRTYYVNSAGKQVEKIATPAPVAAPVAPKVLTPAEQKSLDQKAVKASADKAAEAEKSKMAAEQAEKSKQAQLKADLQAKQAARAAAAKAPAPVASKPSGFNFMSKGGSSGSSSRSSGSSSRSGRR